MEADPKIIMIGSALADTSCVRATNPAPCVLHVTQSLFNPLVATMYQPPSGSPWLVGQPLMLQVEYQYNPSFFQPGRRGLLYIMQMEMALLRACRRSWRGPLGPKLNKYQEVQVNRCRFSRESRALGCCWLPQKVCS